MGNHFQTVVDKEASETDAANLGHAILTWLVREGIVDSELRDYELTGRSGYAPGPEYEKVTGAPDEFLLSTCNNGLDIITQRTVFHAGGQVFELICSQCSSRFEPADGWGDAVEEWYKRCGPGMLPCPQCGYRQPITEWQHDPPYAFANLGFEFWNWPRFTDGFIEEFGKRLHHRVVLITGKL